MFVTNYELKMKPFPTLLPQTEFVVGSFNLNPRIQITKHYFYIIYKNCCQYIFDIFLNHPLRLPINNIQTNKQKTPARPIIDNDYIWQLRNISDTP